MLQDGTPSGFATRKALALLVYLAVEGGTHSREKLTALFWPESDNERGRSTLRRTLAYLRDGLGPRADMALDSRRDSLRLMPGALDLDVNVLQDAWLAARTSSLIPAGLALLQVAAGRCRGDFLTGFSLPDAPEFDDWASAQREHWHRRMSGVFDRLSLWQSEAGELTAAIETAAGWVDRDPLNETAHRRLIQTLQTAGDRSGARRALARCRENLARELNADLAPETEALADRLDGWTVGRPVCLRAIAAGR